jgi:predicted nucleotidyltransferase
MESTAFLSVRVPETVRNRLKAIAAERGEKLQDLIGGLIERFLEEAERRPPLLADVVHSLRTREASLRGRGVAGLWVFGSVARGDAKAESDIDLAVDFAPEAEISLLDVARLKLDLEELLRRPVGLGERSAMKPPVAASAEREWVHVF